MFSFQFSLLLIAHAWPLINSDVAELATYRVSQNFGEVVNRILALKILTWNESWVLRNSFKKPRGLPEIAYFSEKKNHCFVNPFNFKNSHFEPFLCRLWENEKISYKKIEHSSWHRTQVTGIHNFAKVLTHPVVCLFFLSFFVPTHPTSKESKFVSLYSESYAFGARKCFLEIIISYLKPVKYFFHNYTCLITLCSLFPWFE